MTAKLHIVGDPTFVSKRIIRVLGVGKQWEGNWFVVHVTHMINDNGYVCIGDITRNSSYDQDKEAQAVINTKVNKKRLNVKQFLKKYPKSVYKRLYA